MNVTIDTTTILDHASNMSAGSSGVQVGITLVNACELIFGSLGILGNLLCIVIFKRRSRQNHTNFLIIMQAGVDCVASALMVCLTITSILNPPVPSHWLMGSIYCKFWTSYVLLWSSFAISTFNLTIISIERYIAVVHPLGYVKVFKRSSVVFIAMLTWFLAPTINIAYNVVVNYFDVDDGVCVESFNKTQKVISIVLFFWEYFFPLCIMIFSFVSIARTLLKMNKVSNLMSANSLNETSQVSHVPVRNSSSHHISERSSTLHVSCLAQEPDGQPGHGTGPTHMNNVFTSHPHVPEHPTESQIYVIPTTAKPGCSTSNATGNHSKKPDIIPKLLTVKQAGNGVRPRGKRQAGASVRRLNITKVLLLVSLGFFVCWSPNQWYFLLLNLGAINFSFVPYRVTIVMSTCNTCINPFIYALRIKTFRNEFLSMIKCNNRT